MSATNTGNTLGTTGTTPTTSTTGTTGHTTTGTTTGGGHGQAGQVASGIKGVFAKVHGAGEEIRGQFNGAVDEAFHENTGVAKNNSVATAGRNEMETGQFAHGTKQREGVQPDVGLGGRSERST